MKRVRIIEFLRDCPVYTRLYSPLYGYCEFLECSQNFIYVRGSKVDPKYNKCHDVIYKFNEIGQPCGTVYEDNEIEYSECMLFPSHTYKSWKNWQEHLFKDGDYIIYRNHPLMGIPYCSVFKIKGFNGKYLECIDKDNANISILNTELKNYRYAMKDEQISFRELQEKFKKDNEKKTTDYSKFYYIENTTYSDIIVYCKTMDEALERLKDYRDCGIICQIYEVKFGKNPKGRLVYNKE